MFYFANQRLEWVIIHDFLHHLNERKKLKCPFHSWPIDQKPKSFYFEKDWNTVNHLKRKKSIVLFQQRSNTRTDFIIFWGLLFFVLFLHFCFGEHQVFKTQLVRRDFWINWIITTLYQSGSSSILLLASSSADWYDVILTYDADLLQ